MYIVPENYFQKLSTKIYMLILTDFPMYYIS